MKHGIKATLSATRSGIGIAVIASSTIYSAIRFVSPDGSDANSGAIDSPWQTVGKAANWAGPGDTVCLRKGTYKEQLVPQKSGTQSAPVVYRAFPNENAVIDLKDVNISPESGIIQISDKQHIIIEGLETRNSKGTGIWIVDGSYITIRKNHTYNTFSSGIIVSEFAKQNRHIYIDSNDVELANNDGGQECISISKCDSFIVSGNHIHDGGPGSFGGEGIDTKFGSSNGKVCNNYVHHVARQGLYADAWTISTSNIEFYNNVVHDCAFGIGAASEQGGHLKDVYFYNNTVYNCPGPGIYILITAGPLENIQFTNNTIHNTGYEWGGGIRLSRASQATKVLVRNNVFTGMKAATITNTDMPLTELTVDHNLTDATNTAEASWFLRGAPRYVDVLNKDFRLALGSPGIDEGSMDVYAGVLSSTDLLGNRRVMAALNREQAIIDVGAYELRTENSVRRTLSAASKRVPYGETFRFDLAGRTARSFESRPASGLLIYQRSNNAARIVYPGARQRQVEAMH